jgi:hypothetical protein
LIAAYFACNFYCFHVDPTCFAGGLSPAIIMGVEQMMEYVGVDSLVERKQALSFLL